MSSSTPQTLSSSLSRVVDVDVRHALSVGQRIGLLYYHPSSPSSSRGTSVKPRATTLHSSASTSTLARSLAPPRRVLPTSFAHQINPSLSETNKHFVTKYFTQTYKFFTLHQMSDYETFVIYTSYNLNQLFQSDIHMDDDRLGLGRRRRRRRRRDGKHVGRSSIRTAVHAQGTYERRRRRAEVNEMDGCVRGLYTRLTRRRRNRGARDARDRPSEGASDHRTDERTRALGTRIVTAPRTTRWM